MKVTMEHSTQKVGMFKSAPTIDLTVEFSEVEKAAIKQSGLANYVYYSPPKHTHFNERMQGDCEVSHLLKYGKCSITFQDVAAARANEPAIKEALRTLKGAIDQNTGPTKSESFEL